MKLSTLLDVIRAADAIDRARPHEDYAGYCRLRGQLAGAVIMLKIKLEKEGFDVPITKEQE